MNLNASVLFNENKLMSAIEYMKMFGASGNKSYNITNDIGEKGEFLDNSEVTIGIYGDEKINELIIKQNLDRDYKEICIPFYSNTSLITGTGSDRRKIGNIYVKRMSSAECFSITNDDGITLTIGTIHIEKVNKLVLSGVYANKLKLYYKKRMFINLTGKVKTIDSISDAITYRGIRSLMTDEFLELLSDKGKLWITSHIRKDTFMSFVGLNLAGRLSISGKKFEADEIPNEIFEAIRKLMSADWRANGHTSKLLIQ